MLVRTINNGVVQDPQVGQTLDIGYDNQGNPIIVEDNTVNISAYLDTGSSSILISTDTAQNLGRCEQIKAFPPPPTMARR